MKFFKYIATSLVLVASLTAQAKTTLKLAHAAPTSDLQQNLSEFFAEEVEKRTNGEVVVQIFPQGQLGNDQQMISGTRSGIIDIQMTGLNNFLGFMPDVGGLLLPYMFKDRQHAYRVLDGEIGQQVNKEFEQYGMKGLGFPENGYRNITNNRKPIRTPEDVVGLKIRTNNSVALNQAFDLLKANPQPMPIAELYTALETNVVEAQEHPIGITYSFKYYEVQKYLSLTEHSYSMLALTMNLKKFNKLTEEQQKVILEVGKEAVDLQRQLSIDKEGEMIEELKAHGMEVNTDVDKAAFQKIVQPTWDSYIKDYGDEMIKAIQAAGEQSN